jgi:hypothetical protein
MIERKLGVGVCGLSRPDDARPAVKGGLDILGQDLDRGRRGRAGCGGGSGNFVGTGGRMFDARTRGFDGAASGGIFGGILRMGLAGGWCGLLSHTDLADEARALDNCQVCGAEVAGDPCGGAEAALEN